MHAWILIKLHSPLERSLQAAVAVDVVLASFDARRHESRLRPHSLFDARLKELRRRHRVVRDNVPFYTFELRPD